MSKQTKQQCSSKAFAQPAPYLWPSDSEREQDSLFVMKAEYTPPAARKSAVAFNKHEHIRLDEYFWLRERENKEVLEYLEAENRYLERVMSPLKGLRKELFEEMKGRLTPSDVSVPYQLGEYFYYTRYEKGGEYPLYCRRKGSMKAAEEVLADGNELARDESFYNFRIQTSPNQQLLAIVADTVGRRFYTLFFKDLHSGKLLADTLPSMTGNMVWANDNKTLYYTRQNPTTLRSCQVYRHVLGTAAEDDVLVYEEKDERFSCFLSKTKSQQYIILHSGSTLSDECRILDAEDEQAVFRLVQPRESGLLYAIEHLEDTLYIRTNLEAENFRLVQAPLANPGKAQWKDVIPHRSHVLLEDFDIFQNFLVLDERTQGLNSIRIIRWQDQQEHRLDFAAPTYLAYIGHNPDLASDLLRIEYSSLTSPPSTYQYDMAGGQKKLLKRQEVLGGFDPDDYRSEWLMVTAQDGAQIPLSVVYHRDTPLDGTAPCLLHAYGSYGDSMEADFDPARLPLLERGCVFAIAHIRGGQEMGRHWYEGGKLLQKKNTFTDFIACSEYLLEKGYSAADKLFAMGGSAGGLLMGAVTNMRPELYKGVISSVPFVDVISTMLDASIPLTTGEYDEWGNPHLKEYYDYMLSYSPYDNIEAKDYPHMLVTSGLHDSQVQYWEPTKYVARLREKKTDSNLLLLYTNMTAGHDGSTGRFEALKEVALAWAFLLDLAGKASTKPLVTEKSSPLEVVLP